MPSDSERRPPPNEAAPGGDDVPPSGEEARAQRRATSLPLVWLSLGLLVIGLFAAWMAAVPPFERGAGKPSPATAAHLAPGPPAPIRN